MARTKNGGRRILPRTPIFRVFYSLTYTLLYLLTLLILAITPISMIYSSIDQSALQYTFMIGGAYLLIAVVAIFLYSSRLYTNRSILSAVGKAYVPVEDGEVGRAVRKMIVKQLGRSAIVAWEGRPRDLYGEILLAGQEGILPNDFEKVSINEYTVGSEIAVDPASPPWGDVQHAGWSSPSHREDNKNPDVQFADVIAELPNLIEARAVSRAPPDPTMTPVQGQPSLADPAIVDLLTRPSNMALRDYLTQLGYLGLIQPPEIGQSFVAQYERARFSGRPVSTTDFKSLMETFAVLLAGMTGLNKLIVDEIRAQTDHKDFDLDVPTLSLPAYDALRLPTPRSLSSQSSIESPVTAREARSSRAATPFMGLESESEESLSSVVHHETDEGGICSPDRDMESSFYSMQEPSSSTLPSDAGSVLVRDTYDGG